MVEGTKGKEAVARRGILKYPSIETAFTVVDFDVESWKEASSFYHSILKNYSKAVLPRFVRLELIVIA